MDIEQLFLKKEELPILYKSCFEIPIHPKLLDENVKLDKSIAQKLFPQAAEDWYKNLREYAKTEEAKEEREWIENVFLKEKPRITKLHNHQYLDFWKDEVWMLDNCFVAGFSINSNSGGSLYFDKGDFNCKTLIPGMYIKFSEEKVKEFECEKIGEYSKTFVYASHNIDNYPGALFLRNWAILYMNETFKQVF